MSLMVLGNWLDVRGPDGASAPQWIYAALGVAMAILGAALLRLVAAYGRARRSRERAALHVPSNLRCESSRV